MSVLQIYAARNLLNAPAEHCRTLSFWEFLSKDLSDNDTPINNAPAREALKDDSTMKELYDRLVKAQWRLARNRERLVETNKPVWTCESSSEDLPEKKRPLPNAVVDNATPQSTATPTSVMRKRRRVVNSEKVHMTAAQISLGKKVSHFIVMRRRSPNELAMELGISFLQLQKFLEGDKAKAVNARTHAATETLLRSWLKSEEGCD